MGTEEIRFTLTHNDKISTLSGRPEICSDFYRMPSECFGWSDPIMGAGNLLKEVKMRQHIKNLTDNLIGKNRYDDVQEMLNHDGFLEFIKIDLENGDISCMKPETLGKILCALEIGEVIASKKDLFKGIHFSGNCEEMLREMVALCLACLIRDRLADGINGNSPI